MATSCRYPGVSFEEMAIFKALGVLVAFYVGNAIFRGEVHAKKMAWGETVSREASPGYFWVVIGVYALLALALLTVF